MTLGPLQTEWLRALRSGEFPQGRGCLIREPESGGDVCDHCCLGVACMVAYANGVRLRFTPAEHFALSIDGERSFLPQRVVEAMRFRDNGYGSPLVSINDVGKPFAEIANYIEQDAAEIFEGPA